MADATVKHDKPPFEACYVTGWMTDRLQAGVKPDYGYPASPLPKTTGEPMEMITGFVAGMACRPV